MSVLHVRANGDGTPTVFVHGWMTSGGVWDDLLGVLDGGRRFLVADLPGTGGTARGDGALTLERLADLVLAALDHAGVDRFDLVGHSMGGQLAALVAASAGARVSSLALLTPVPLSGVPLPPALHDLFRDSGEDRDAQGRILDMACRELPATARARLLDDAGRIAKAVVAETFAAWSTGGHAERYAAITAPTFVLATDDPFLPVDFLRDAVAARIPGARLEHLAGPGHYPQVERPREVATALARHWERAAA